MDVKDVGSNPIYYPGANNKSDRKKPKEKGGVISTKGEEAANEGGSGEGIYKEAEKTEFGTKEGSESANKGGESDRGVYNGRRA